MGQDLFTSSVRVPEAVLTLACCTLPLFGVMLHSLGPSNKRRLPWQQSLEGGRLWVPADQHLACLSGVLYCQSSLLWLPALCLRTDGLPLPFPT